MAAAIVVALVGVAAVAYAAHVGTTYAGYGRVRPPADAAGRDTVLDLLMPRYDVVERHHVRVEAPACLVLDEAQVMDIARAPLARAIFRTRELIMGADAGRTSSKGLIEDMKAIGWGQLAEVKDREIVMGAVTRPWEANPVFRAIPPQDFAAFAEPDYVQIAWTLRADPVDANTSIFRTETRARATDPGARARFRWYWAFLSPGIILIRWAMLRPLKGSAERRAGRTGTNHE